MKKIILIVLGAALIAAFICTQIIDTKELRFTVKIANCGTYDLPLDEEEYEKMETLDVEFDAQYSKRLLGSAKIEGTVTFDGKTYQIREIQPADKGRWFLVLWHENDPYVKCTYMWTTHDLERFYMGYEGDLWFGPAEDCAALIGSLDAFGLLY